MSIQLCAWRIICCVLGWFSWVLRISSCCASFVYDVAYDGSIIEKVGALGQAFSLIGADKSIIEGLDANKKL